MSKAARLFSSKRWETIDAYHAEWNDRSAFMLSWLPADAQSLADLGSGTCALRALCPKTVRYVAVDVSTNLGADVALNFNSNFDAELLPDADVAILSGLIEYIVDVDGFFKKLNRKYKTLIVSYNALRRQPKTTASLQPRRSLGWVNEFTPAELIAKFESAHYVVEKLQNDSQLKSMSFQLFMMCKAN